MTDKVINLADLRDRRTHQQIVGNANDIVVGLKELVAGWESGQYSTAKEIEDFILGILEMLHHLQASMASAPAATVDGDNPPF
jgi:hypothetical protein